MNTLRFRGIPYFQSDRDIPTISSKNIACYRGHKYNLREPVAIDRPQTSCSQTSAVICKFRGVSYIVEL